MTPEEPLQDFQSHSTFSTWLGVVLLFAFFGLLVLVIVGASPRASDYEQKRAQVRVEKLETMRKETAKALTSYAWVDKTKGTVRVPITEAMRLTMAELAERKPAPANPILAPAVATSPAPASPTTQSNPPSMAPSPAAPNPSPVPAKAP